PTPAGTPAALPDLHRRASRTPTRASRGRRAPHATPGRRCARGPARGTRRATAEPGRLRSRRVGRRRTGSAERTEEAGARPGVARAPPLLFDDEEQGVAVAVVVRLANPLAIARRVALAPQLPAATAPEHRPALGERAPERLLVHPREHQ